MTTAVVQGDLQFYTPTGGSREREPLVYPNKKIHPRIEELARKLTSVFIETEVGLFKVGEPSLTVGATGRQDIFQQEVSQVLSYHLEGVIDNNNEWANVQEIVPRLIQILLDRDGNHIQAVSRQQAINVIAFAVDVARNPKLLGDTILLVAFGGSDDAHATMRLPAYPLSVLHIHQALQNFYHDRANTALALAQRVKLYQQAIAEAGPGLDKNARRALDAQLSVDLSEGKRNLPDLTTDERNAVLERKAIATDFPTIHLTYAHNAAVEVNTRGLPEAARRQKRTAILSRTAGNKQILREIVNAYPDVAPFVRDIEDIPWDQQPLITRMHIAYMADILHGVEIDPTGDTAVKGALKRLRKAGKTHQGEEGYLEYAGAHPAIFLDAYDLPFAPTLQEVTHAPAAVITVGGEPEEDFHAVRYYLTTHADAYGFLGFLLNQRNQLKGNDRARLEQVIKEVVLWRDNGQHSPTQHTIHLSTSVGGYPVYYFRAADKPYGSISLGQHIRTLEDELANAEAQQPHDETSAQELLAKRSELYHLLVDLKAIQKAKTRQRRI